MTETRRHVTMAVKAYQFSYARTSAQPLARWAARAKREMSTPITEYEGTWEEIAAHASEFEGHRLCLTVLSPDQPAPLSLQDRRAFLKLPLAERRRLLAEQAEQLVTHYEKDPEWREFLSGDAL